MHFVVDRYLRDALSEAETAEFEERLVWDRELMDELDLAESLRDGLRRALDKNEVSRASGITRVTGHIREFFATPMYAAAASFLLAVGLTVTALLGPIAPTGSSDNAQFASTEIVPLFTTRSDGIAEIKVSKSIWTVLLVDAPPSYVAFRATVRRQGAAGDPVWVRHELAPTYPDSLAIGMPGELLPAGRYVLALEGRDDEGSYQHIQDIVFDSASAE
jgi:hypothetical protein